MNRRLLPTMALLLVGSGTCALVYQVVWMREFRLVFGYSTAASAATLAIFMGGLGAGGFFWGRRVDGHENPLALYARLELLISLSAALTPILVLVAQALYLPTGGSQVLGAFAATAVRLVLATLVLAVPTFLMGGTLPAAARAATPDDDRSRGNLSVLYGANTLGAVAGALVSTFWLIEALGNRGTLWAASAVNAAVGFVAWRASRGAPAPDPAGRAPEPARTKKQDRAAKGAGPAVPAGFALAAAAIVGFAFFLMEIVWYRMLTPILGGSVYTFGLILAVALLGIGTGGIAYRVWETRWQPTIAAFSWTCALEAAWLALPYALGDRLALLALSLRPPEGGHFWPLIGGWLVVTAIVALPAALVAGFQFPLLIALLGRGRTEIGRDVGRAYGWNTVGAILGSLAGGFGFLPWLSALGTWKAVVAMLALLCGAALVVSRRQGRVRPGAAAPLAAAALACAMLSLTGPTAAWRYSSIGAGRSDLKEFAPNAVRDWANGMRRTLAAEQDGVEASVAVRVASKKGFAILSNGKSDGSGRGDLGTLMMTGGLGPILHPGAKRAMVVGLGTGVSAGWLAASPAIERVDVFELEPAIAEAAEAFGDANRQVLRDPKVRVIFGDARELILTTRDRYDIIVSQPSNPYRAGVASLFTREFYGAALARLNPGGMFLQWVQGYEVDRAAVDSVYATLGSVFPSVETWQLEAYDILFVASREPVRYDAEALRRRLQDEPFSRCLNLAWRARGLEGLLAHYVAGPATARRIAARSAGAINTDDRMRLEFAFAQSAGGETSDLMSGLRREAKALGDDRPPLDDAQVDWTAVAYQRDSAYVFEGVPPADDGAGGEDPERRERTAAKVAFYTGNLAPAAPVWRRLPRAPLDTLELAAFAEALASSGDETAAGAIDALRPHQPGEADAILGLLRWRQRRVPEAAAALEASLTRYAREPWPMVELMSRTLDTSVEVARRDPEFARRLWTLLRAPFSLAVLQAKRQNTLIALADVLGEGRCVEAFGQLEPNVPWQRSFLEQRVKCYEAASHPRAARSRADLAAFVAAEGLK